MTNAAFCISYEMHQETGLTPSPTCPPGKVVSAKAGCGRSGNKLDFSHASVLLGQSQEDFLCRPTSLFRR